MTAPTDTPALWEGEALKILTAEFCAIRCEALGPGCSCCTTPATCDCEANARAALGKLTPHLVRRPAWPDDVAPRPLRAHLWFVSDANGKVFAKVRAVGTEGDDAQLAAALCAAVNAGMGEG